MKNFYAATKTAARIYKVDENEVRRNYRKRISEINGNQMKAAVIKAHDIYNYVPVAERKTQA